jgi:hypothetical protein
VWIATRPIETFGKEIYDLVSSFPGSEIYNTYSGDNRMDILSVTIRAYIDFKAEAVFVVSNKYITDKVVYGCESRCIPCFGAIWDS